MTTLPCSNSTCRHVCEGRRGRKHVGVLRAGGAGGAAQLAARPAHLARRVALVGAGQVLDFDPVGLPNQNRVSAAPAQVASSEHAEAEVYGPPHEQDLECHA